MSGNIMSYGIYMIFLYIIKEYFDIFFSKRELKKELFVLIWFGYYFLQLIVGDVIQDPIISLFFNIISLAALCEIIYKGSVKSKIIISFSIVVIWMVIELLTAYLLFIFVLNEKQVIEMGSIISKIILILVIKVIRNKVSRDSLKDVSLQYWIYLFSLPGCSIFILYNLYRDSYYTIEENYTFNSISMFLILLLNLFFYKIYEKLSADTEMQKQSYIYEKQMQLFMEQIQEREKMDLEIRELKHNIKGHLICLNEYIQQDNIKSLKEYFSDMYKYLDVNGDKRICETGNIVIDTVINAKYRESTSQHINFESQINIPSNTVFSNADMSVILGNALDNAIEATLKVNSSKRYIRIRMAFHHQNLLIEICNSFNGIVKKDKEGEYLTLKRDSKNHGMGIRSIKKAALRYNGLVSTEYTHNEFGLTILLYSME